MRTASPENTFPEDGVNRQPEEATPILELRGITFAYPGQAPIFEDFSWGVGRGEAWAVIGPSGCGKSTLLMLLAGLLHPSKGEIRGDSRPLLRPRPGTGLVIQDFGLLPWATVRENIALGLRVRSLYGPDGVHAPRGDQPAGDVAGWLERLGLRGVAESYPGRISGGQRQRTALARSLVLEPDVLLLDEPFSAVDAPTREDLQRTVLELQAERGISLVTVTHSIPEALRMGRRILALSRPPNRTARMVENHDEAAQGDVAGVLRQLVEEAR